MENISNGFTNGASRFTLEDLNPDLVSMNGLPMPPSSNRMYGNRARGQSFYPRKILLEYQEEMSRYPFQDRILFKKHLATAQAWKSRRIECQCDSIYYFKRESLFYANNTFKKNDVSNRIKAFHDAVVKILGVDDCIFWRAFEEKRVLVNGDREYVDVRIYPIYRA